jgi:hypothetical protein
MNEFGIKELFEEDLEKAPEIIKINCKAGYDPTAKKYYLVLPFWTRYSEILSLVKWSNEIQYLRKNGNTIAVVLTKVRK